MSKLNVEFDISFVPSGRGKARCEAERLGRPMRETVPQIIWTCSKCGKSGELSVPPARYHCLDQELAGQAHALASPECAEEWGGEHVSLTMDAEEYPD